MSSEPQRGRSQSPARVLESAVRVGKRVRGQFKLLEMEEKRPGQWQQTMEITVEIEGEAKPALMSEWITQFFV